MLDILHRRQQRRKKKHLKDDLYFVLSHPKLVPAISIKGESSSMQHQIFVRNSHMGAAMEMKTDSKIQKPAGKFARKKQSFCKLR